MTAAALGFTLVVALWQQNSAPAHAVAPYAQPNGTPSQATSHPEAWGSVLDAPIKLIYPFYAPNSDYSAGHRGVDYEVVDGQPIYAPAAGVVYFVGTVVNRPLISLKVAETDIVEFEPACSDLAVGDSVEAGQVIAIACAGQSGYSQHCQSANCLHYSLRTAVGYLSPLVRSNELAPTVLLPRTGFSF